jgi:hypothetical protein
MIDTRYVGYVWYENRQKLQVSVLAEVSRLDAYCNAQSILTIKEDMERDGCFLTLEGSRKINLQHIVKHHPERFRHLVDLFHFPCSSL